VVHRLGEKLGVKRTPRAAVIKENYGYGAGGLNSCSGSGPKRSLEALSARLAQARDRDAARELGWDSRSAGRGRCNR
jgi:hypothetical protein